MSTRREEVHPSSLDAEASDLAQAHIARWLDDLLPSGPCLVWAGAMPLAAVLAADRGRAVLLVEPRVSDLEQAARHTRAGVKLAGAEALDDEHRFASAVVLADPNDDVEPILGRLLDGRYPVPIGVVVGEASAATSAVAALERRARPATVVRQHLRLASTLGLEDDAAAARRLPARDAEPHSTVVVWGAPAAASVLVGPDAGPVRVWAETEWVQRSIRQVDAELQAADALRLRDMEVRLDEAEHGRREVEAHARGLEARIADLEHSTSWRVTAPLRRLSDRARRP